MKPINRWTVFAASLAIMAYVINRSGNLFYEYYHHNWTHPMQPKCIVAGCLAGAVIGLALGFALFLGVRRIRDWYWAVAALCLGVWVGALISAVVVLFAVGSYWPPETVYGIDPDHLLVYGFTAGGAFIALSTGLAALLSKSHSEPEDGLQWSMDDI